MLSHKANLVLCPSARARPKLAWRHTPAYTGRVPSRSVTSHFTAINASVTPPLRDREQFIAEVRARVAEKRARLAPAPEAPGSDREFEEKYSYLLEGLRRTFEAVGEPGLEVEPFGSSGIRISFRVPDPQHEDTPIIDREIRVSKVDATEEVHLVFSSFQRAERHATFKLSRPQLLRVEAAFVDFLIEGIEPPWLARRRRRDVPAELETDVELRGPGERVEATEQQSLELPFE
jgi:hypothetical protein